MRLTFNMFLREAGIDVSKTRLMRHQDTRMRGSMSVYRLWRAWPDEFARYISIHSINRLEVGGHVAHFVLDPVGDLVFVALQKVVSATLNTEPVELPYLARIDPPGTVHTYEFEPVEALEPFAGLLAIDWGPGTRSWCQRAHLQDKPIIELRRDVRDVEWPGYLDLTITADEVSSLAPNWRAKLAAASGVYLLLCPETALQYIGVAMGEDGFLGRFEDYGRTGHGGNTRLRQRLEQTSAPLQISILEVFGSDVSDRDALTAETRWKTKLGSRAFGLNAN